MTLLLVVVLVILLFGGVGFGYRSGYAGTPYIGGIGGLLLVLLLLYAFGVFGPVR